MSQHCLERFATLRKRRVRRIEDADARPPHPNWFSCVWVAQDVCHGFCQEFAWNLPRFCHRIMPRMPKSTLGWCKSQPQIAQGTLKSSPRAPMRTHFEFFLFSFSGFFGSPRPPQEGPRGPKRSLRAAQERPRESQETFQYASGTFSKGPKVMKKRYTCSYIF